MIRLSKISGQESVNREISPHSTVTTGHYIDNLYIVGNKLKLSTTSLQDISSYPNDLTVYLKTYFDFGYYMGICPFRYTIRKQRIGKKMDKFALHMWTPQWFICVVLNVLCILRILTEARLNLPVRNSAKYVQNAELYFLLIMNLFNIGYKVTFIKRLFWNKEQFLNLINFAGCEKSLRPSELSQRIGKRSVIVLVLMLNIGMAVLSLIAGKYFVVGGFSHWSPTWWYRRLVATTRYTFFYGDRLANNQAPEVTDITLLDNCMAIIHLIGLISRYVLGYYTDLLIFAMAMTLWAAARSFATSLGGISDVRFLDYDDGHESYEYHFGKEAQTKWAKIKDSALQENWDKIYRRFKAIRMLSFLVNEALGSIVAWFLGNAIFAYSLSLDAIFIAKDAHKRVGLVFNYFCAFGVLFVSADICQQMEAIKFWLTNDENRRKVPNDRLNIVFHEMIIKDIGIRGGNIFTVTYPIVATFIGTLLTYFVISVQHNSPDG